MRYYIGEKGNNGIIKEMKAYYCLLLAKNIKYIRPLNNHLPNLKNNPK